MEMKNVPMDRTRVKRLAWEKFVKQTSLTVEMEIVSKVASSVMNTKTVLIIMMK